MARIAASELGRLRTAAASAVSAKFMSRLDARVVGLIGTGWQAAHQVLAVALVRQIDEVRVFGRNSPGRDRFVADLAPKLKA